MDGGQMYTVRNIYVENLPNWRNMKKQLAKQKLLEEFDLWTHKQKYGDKPTEYNGLNFYAYVESEKSYLLNFSCSGDKWQQLKSWLYETSRIRENPRHCM